MTGSPGSAAVFRHDLARVAVVAWAVLAALVVPAADGDRTALGCGALAVLLAGLALGWYPAVRVDDDGVLLVNPWTTTRLGWGSVDDVRQQWLLTVVADGVPHRAWAVPGPRRMRSLWEKHWTEHQGVFERDALPALAAVSARGEGTLGLGDAALVTAQRYAARAAFCRPAAPARTPSVPGRVLLAAAAVLAVAAALL